MKLSKLLLGLMVGCAALAVNAQTVIKFSHVVAVDTPKGKASEFFAKKAAELTKGKVKVEVATYERGQGQTARAVAYLDAADLRPLVHALKAGQFEALFAGHFESFGGSQRQGSVESRTLRLEHDPGEGGRFSRFPLRLTVTNGPGKLTPTGAITPAVISTSKGDIALDLYDDETPLTVANFKRLAKLGFFNGLNFHRVEDWVAQGGDGEASGRLATSIPLEPNWYRSFADVGQIGMARTDYIHSADSQFYINTKIADWLDPTSDTNGYSLFGAVTGGLDVATSIAVGDLINSVVITEGP